MATAFIFFHHRCSLILQSEAIETRHVRSLPASEVLELIIINRNHMIKRAACLLNIMTPLMRNRVWMSKGAKPGKQEPVPEPVVELTPQEEIRQYLNFGQQSISPSEQQIIDEQFEDLSPEEKTMLNELADQIMSLKTSSFMELVKLGGLGTSTGFYVASQELSAEELEKSVRRLRKEE